MTEVQTVRRAGVVAPDGSSHPFTAAARIAPAHDALDAPAPRFSRRFSLTGEVESATLSITSWGANLPLINGRRVSQDELAPGWTEYRHRLIHDTYEVADLLRDGDNELDVIVGNGWFRGRLGRPARRDLYGTRRAVLAQLDVRFRDGRTWSLGTDESWTVRDSEVVSDDLYDGCVLDLTTSGTALVRRVVSEPVGDVALVARDFPPIRVTDELRPIDLQWQADGSVIIDFGQNLVGWVRLDLGPVSAGQRVVVRHAEVLQDGALALRPLRDARAADAYLLPRSDELTLEPRFTYHGFRYAQVDGVAREQLRSVRARVVGSAMTRTAWMEISDPLLNRLHDNIAWSMRGNFVGLPTDCPQRDERLGWTADIQVFAPTATVLFDSASLLRSWLEDLYLAQLPDGSVPVVVPDIYRRDTVATAGWGDAVVVVPWELYQHTGDTELLARAFAPMTRWIDRVARAAGPDCLWVGGHQYGDWLDPTAPPDDPAAAVTDPDFVATACFYRSTELAARAAGVLGRAADRERLEELAQRIRSAFRDAFVTPVGRLTADTQAGYAMAICFGLLEPDQLRQAGDRLADLVRRSGHTIATGFLGTPLILDALVATGHQRVAMRLLRQTAAPSWLYPVTAGATTVWERWDSLLPDGRVNPGEMTSFNHYAFGAVGDWMHRYLGGVTRTAPGWSRFRVRPPLGNGLDHATFRYDSPRGTIHTGWLEENGVMTFDLTVPPGARADVELPDRSCSVGEGRHRFVLRADRPGFPSGGTVREAIDDVSVWERVVAAVLVHRPGWTPARVAAATRPYLDLPLPDFARVVGLSIPTAAEDDLRARLRMITRDR